MRLGSQWMSGIALVWANGLTFRVGDEPQPVADYGSAVVATLLGDRGEFYAAARAVQPDVSSLAAGFAFQNWTTALAQSRAPSEEQSDRQHGNRCHHTRNHGSGCLQHGLAETARQKGFFFSCMLTSQMLPAIVFVIPLFILFSRLNLVNTLPGLVLADLTFTVPFALIMLRAYLADFPYELVEAALVDGANQFQAFFVVVLPIMLPGLITIAIFSFLIPWGDLIFALSLMTDTGLQPLTVVLYKAVGQYGIDWTFLPPGSLLTAIPAVLFVIGASRFIVAGLTKGALR